MRLTPTERVHAVCALVVPLALVLMYAPGKEQPLTASESLERCVDGAFSAPAGHAYGVTIPEACIAVSDIRPAHGRY